MLLIRKVAPKVTRATAEEEFFFIETSSLMLHLLIERILGFWCSLLRQAERRVETIVQMSASE
jgi:hypothetical protein